MSTLSLRVPEDLKLELEQLSEKEHKPVSDLVRESVRRYVAVERFRQLREQTLPYAKAQGILTDEDVFAQL